MDPISIFNSDMLFDKMGKDLGDQKQISFGEALGIVRAEIEKDEKFLGKIGDIEKSGKRNSSEVYRATIAAYNEKVKNIILNKKIRVFGANSYEILAQDLVSDICGFGPLRRAFEDNSISDIYVNRYDEIFVEKNGQNQRYKHVFRDEDHWKQTLDRILSIDGKKIDSAANQAVNFEIYGNRGSAVNETLSTGGLSCAFRKHGQAFVDAKKLLDQSVLNEDILDFLGLAIRGGLNVICAGTTGSGKTTTLQALFNEFVDDQRVFVVEDTRELQIDADNIVYMVCPDSTTGASSKNENVKQYEMQDLIYLALRQKPRMIITGEIRGKESKAYLDAAATGHASYATLHAGTPIDAINRIVERFAEAGTELSSNMIERKICSAVDLVFIQANKPNIGRRIVYVTEIGYDIDNSKPILNTLFEFNAETKSFEQKGFITKTLRKKMMINGMLVEDVDKWFEKKPDQTQGGGDDEYR